jgi:hypothetical protein
VLEQVSQDAATGPLIDVEPDKLRTAIGRADGIFRGLR